MSKKRSPVFLFALLPAACGGTDPMMAPSATDSGRSPDVTQLNGTASPAGDDGGLSGIFAFQATCWDPTQDISTVPDKTCATANDCKEVTNVGCGGAMVFAVNNAAECEPLPAPPCAPVSSDNPPSPYRWLVETGDTTEDIAAIALRCLAGECQTYVRP